MLRTCRITLSVPASNTEYPRCKHIPLLRAKREVFEWIKTGKKTIDIRKGYGREGDIAFIQSGKDHLKLRIVRKEQGRLEEVITQQNYKRIIPTAKTVKDAIDYLQDIYGKKYEGIYTAYYLEQNQKESDDQ